MLGASLIPDADFKDIIISRLGLVEWEPAEAWVLRADGYVRDTPTPRQTGLTNIIDMNKTVVGWGLGRRLGDWGEIEVFLQHHRLASEKVVKRPPATGSFEADGDILQFGAGVTIDF